VVCYVDTSVSEGPVASIFRLKLPFIILVDAMVLCYMMSSFYVGISVSQGPVASIFRLTLLFIVLVYAMVLWYVICGLLRRYQHFGGSCLSSG
jgi:hypothetical protein